MIIFLFYAAIVWYLAFRWRRHWLGFACVLAGLAFIWLSSLLIESLQRWLARSGSSMTMDARLMHMLLGVEAGMVWIVGVFFACLPREQPEKPCRRCRYELSGLEETNPTCPECGLANAAAKVRLAVCAECGRHTLIQRSKHVCDACQAARSLPAAVPRA